jgi:hypothetical protein
VSTALRNGKSFNKNGESWTVFTHKINFNYYHFDIHKLVEGATFLPAIEVALAPPIQTKLMQI